MDNRLSSQKNTQEERDWSRSRVSTELKEIGLSVREVSRLAGLHEDTLATVFRGPLPKYEKLIGKALGLDPASIWPSRYKNTHSEIK